MLDKGRGDIDFIIMTSAGDEDNFLELLYTFMKVYPNEQRQSARTKLQKRLLELVSLKKVGIYEANIGAGIKPADYPHLSLENATRLINSEAPWDDQWPTENIRYYLYTIDENFHGTYYGEQKS